MKKNSIVVLTIIFLLGLTVTSYAQLKKYEPDYANEESKKLVEKMIEAHGGWEKWAEAPSLSFDNIFFNTGAQQGQNPWWVSSEIIEQSSESRVYQEWPIINSALAYDGKKTWAKENFRIGNQPKFMVHFFYYFIGLPWLTQDNNVKLGPVEKKMYGNSYFNQPEREVFTILMEFKEAPTVGKTKNDFFRLYIDPLNYTIVAYEYAIGYGAMLDLLGVPSGRKFMGPVFRHIDANTNVDGLMFPTQMHTTNMDQSRVYGQHILMNYSITKEFDESLLDMPEDGVIDQSSSERESK